jgi:hypothetical protein
VISVNVGTSSPFFGVASYPDPAALTFPTPPAPPTRVDVVTDADFSLNVDRPVNVIASRPVTAYLDGGTATGSMANVSLVVNENRSVTFGKDLAGGISLEFRAGATAGFSNYEVINDSPVYFHYNALPQTIPVLRGGGLITSFGGDVRVGAGDFFGEFILEPPWSSTGPTRSR